MSSLSFGQAASTLAIAQVGLTLGMFEQNVVNAAVLAIVITAFITSYATRFFASRVPPVVVDRPPIGQQVLLDARGAASGPARPRRVRRRARSPGRRSGDPLRRHRRHATIRRPSRRRPRGRRGGRRRTRRRRHGSRRRLVHECDGQPRRRTRRVVGAARLGRTQVGRRLRVRQRHRRCRSGITRSDDRRPSRSSVGTHRRPDSASRVSRGSARTWS